MSENEHASTGRHDWLGWLYKIITGIVLALIPIVIKIGADDIAASIQTGQLVQSLLGDLTAEDKKIRQDIALIALDGAIGKQNPEMMSRIAEQVLYSRPEVNTEDTVASQIIGDRTPTRLGPVLDKLRRLHPEKAKDVAEEHITIRESSGGAADAADQTSRQVTPEAQQIAKVFPHIIYIQFKNEQDRRLVEDLRTALKTALKEEHLLVPGVEKVAGRWSGNGVRYFHEGDKQLAEKVQQATMDFFKGQSPAVRGLSNSPSYVPGQKAPVGQVEIWLERTTE